MIGDTNNFLRAVILNEVKDLSKADGSHRERWSIESVVGELPRVRSG
jgi:hypothetical protein